MFVPLPPLSMNALNLEHSWKTWIQRFEFLKAQYNALEEDVQLAMFLSFTGEEALHVFNSFVLSD